MWWRGARRAPDRWAPSWAPALREPSVPGLAYASIIQEIIALPCGRRKEHFNIHFDRSAAGFCGRRLRHVRRRGIRRHRARVRAEQVGDARERVVRLLAHDLRDGICSTEERSLFIGLAQSKRRVFCVTVLRGGVRGRRVRSSQVWRCTRTGEGLLDAVQLHVGSIF